MQPPKVLSIVWAISVLVKSDSEVGSPGVSGSSRIFACLSPVSQELVIQDSYDTKLYMRDFFYSLKNSARYYIDLTNEETKIKQS